MLFDQMLNHPNAKIHFDSNDLYILENTNDLIKRIKFITSQLLKIEAMNIFSLHEDNFHYLNLQTLMTIIF